MILGSLNTDEDKNLIARLGSKVPFKVRLKASAKKAGREVSDILSPIWKFPQEIKRGIELKRQGRVAEFKPKTAPFRLAEHLITSAGAGYYKRKDPMYRKPTAFMLKRGVKKYVGDVGKTVKLAGETGRPYAFLGGILSPSAWPTLAKLTTASVPIRFGTKAIFQKGLKTPKKTLEESVLETVEATPRNIIFSNVMKQTNPFGTKMGRITMKNLKDMGANKFAQWIGRYAAEGGINVGEGVILNELIGRRPFEDVAVDFLAPGAFDIAGKAGRRILDPLKNSIRQGSVDMFNSTVKELKRRGVKFNNSHLKEFRKIMEDQSGKLDFSAKVWEENLDTYSGKPTPELTPEEKYFKAIAEKINKQNMIEELDMDWKLINKVKKILSSRLFAEGDIESLYRSKDGDIIRKAVERVREVARYQNISDEEALEIIQELPTKSDLSELERGVEELRYKIAPLEEMGTGKRYEGIPYERVGKEIEFAEQKPFVSSGGRRIGETFEKELGVPLSVNKRLKAYLGKFKHVEDAGRLITGEVELKNLDDLDTLAHETGHYLDYSLGKAFSGGKGVKGILSYNKPLREELLRVTEEISGPILGSKSKVAYRRSNKELIADFVRGWIADPDRVRRLAPEFTDIFETAYRTDQDVKFVVDRLNTWNEEFKTLKDYVNSLREIPEIKTELKPFEKRGNILQQIYQESIGDKLWNLIEEAVERVGKTKIGSYFVETRGLPKKVDVILNSRNKLIAGQRMRIDQEIVSPLSKLSKEDSERVATMLQRWEKSGDPRLKDITEETKRELAVWGNEARKLKLLDDEAFWNNVGQYFPFMYSSKEFSDAKKAFGYINYKKLRADLSGYKHRLTDEEMGIKVLENKWGTWPSSKKRIEEVPTEEKIRIGKEAREEMGLIKTAAYPVKKRLDQMIQSVYTVKALNAINKIPGLTSDIKINGWYKLPESRQLGDLAGKYVPKTLFDELNTMVSTKDDIVSAIEKVSSVWKTFKVPFNPATVSRNIQSNILVSWMGGTPIYNPKVIRAGVQSIFTQDAVYKALRDVGQYNGSYSRNELQQLAFETKDGGLDNIISWAVKTYNTPGKIYGAIEDVFKTIMARYAIDNGASPEEAVAYADKWLFDYSRTSKIVEQMRKGPLPFVTWASKIFPRLIETLVRRPSKYIILYALVSAFNAISRNKLKISKEEEDLYKPSWLQEKGTLTILLPERDNLDQLQFFDLSYVAPWGSWLQVGKSGLPQAIEPSNPLTILYNAYISNYDPFFRNVIAPEYLPLREQQKLKAQYVGRGFLPSLAPGGYGYEQISKSLKGIPDYFGRIKTPTSALLRSVAGVKIEPGGEIELTKKFLDIKKKFDDIKNKMYSVSYNQALSEEQRKAELEKLNEYARELNEEYKELVLKQKTVVRLRR